MAARRRARTPVPAFLALVEAVLAVEDVAVAVVVQVAHGQEGGSQAPGEAGVPRGWGHGRHGGPGHTAPRSASAPCIAPAANALANPATSSRPGTPPGPRPHKLMAAVAVESPRTRGAGGHTVALTSPSAGALGRAVHPSAVGCRSRVRCPSPHEPPPHAAQAPACREPTGSRSNYQLGRLPGPRANTTSPLLNSVSPRSGRAAGDGDTPPCPGLLGAMPGCGEPPGLLSHYLWCLFNWPLWSPCCRRTRHGGPCCSGECSPSFITSDPSWGLASAWHWHGAGVCSPAWASPA